MIQSPEDYIKYIKHVNPNPEFCIEEEVIEALRYNFKRDKIDIASTFSTDMMPQKITMGNTPFILWDKGMSFLFGRYLFLLSQVTNGFGSFSYTEQSAYIDSILYAYLSNRFYREPLPSYLFAKRYAELGSLTPFNDRSEAETVNSRLRQTGLDFILKLGIIFMINHEYCHCTFEKDEWKRIQGLKQTSDDLRSIIASKVWVDPSGDARKDYLPEYILKSDDSMLLEELSCDVFAVVNLTMICIKIYGMNSESAFVYSSETVDLLNQFVRLLFACEEQMRLFVDLLQKKPHMQSIGEYLAEYSNPNDRAKGFSERSKLACLIAGKQFMEMRVLPFEFSPHNIPFVNTANIAENNINIKLLEDINNLKFIIDFANKMDYYEKEQHDSLRLDESDLRLSRNKLIGWL